MLVGIGMCYTGFCEFSHPFPRANPKTAVIKTYNNYLRDGSVVKRKFDTNFNERPENQCCIFIVSSGQLKPLTEKSSNKTFISILFGVMN